MAFYLRTSKEKKTEQMALKKIILFQFIVVLGPLLFEFNKVHSASRTAVLTTD